MLESITRNYKLFNLEFNLHATSLLESITRNYKSGPPPSNIPCEVNDIESITRNYKLTHSVKLLFGSNSRINNKKLQDNDDDVSTYEFY